MRVVEVQAQGAVNDDRLRAVLDSVFSQPAYAWREKSDPLGIVRRLWDGFWTWLAELRAEHPDAYRVFLWSLVALMLLILAHAAWVMLRTMQHAARANERSAGPRLAPRRDAAWYRREADRLAAEGRFAEAIQADFLRLLHELEQRRVVQLHPSKTPIEYVREAKVSTAARDDLHSLVRRMYRVAFGGAECRAEDFAAWRASATATRYAAAH
jgi:hypothetical protein